MQQTWMCPCEPKKWQELGFAEYEQPLYLKRILKIPPDLWNLYVMMFKSFFFFFLLFSCTLQKTPVLAEKF